MITFKKIFSYEKNIAFNEMPLIYYEKESNFSSSTSINYISNPDNTAANYVLRESVLFPLNKRNSAINIASNPIKNTMNNSQSSLPNSYNSNHNSCLNISHGDFPLNSYIMFEKSDDSSIDSNSSSDESYE